jgi:hypothetical protein
MRGPNLDVNAGPFEGLAPNRLLQQPQHRIVPGLSDKTAGQHQQITSPRHTHIQQPPLFRLFTRRQFAPDKDRSQIAL